MMYTTFLELAVFRLQMIDFFNTSGDCCDRIWDLFNIRIVR
jgi:hypothetical protein